MSADGTGRAAARTPQAAADPHVWIAILAGMLGGFMAVLDIQIVNASLNDILGSLAATREEASWLSTAYLVAEIIVIPITPMMTRVFGVRSYMVGTSVLFLLCSTLCASAWSLRSMIVFRVFQGLAGGALIPMSMTLVVIKAPARRAQGLALFALLTTLAPALGPTLGGYLSEAHGWPAIFYINWVPGLLLVTGLLYGLGHTPAQWSLLRSVDWLAIACMATGLGCMTVVLEEGNSHDWFDAPLIQAMAALSVAGLLGWVGRYAAGGEPFVQLGLYGRRGFLVASLLAAISGFALYGSSFLLPLYLGQIPGYSPMQIGEVLMWAGLPQIAVMPLAMLAARRLDNRLVCSVGLGLFGLSCLMNTGLDAGSGREQLIASQVVRAIGQPLITLTLSNFAIQGLVTAQRASASALYNMARNLGGSIGIGLLSAALTQREQFHSARVGEMLGAAAAGTLGRLDALGQSFVARGVDPQRARTMAAATLDRVVRRESTMMAYNDCYWILGISLLAGIALLWSLPKTTSATQ